jgi:hypothetical protein
VKEIVERGATSQVKRVFIGATDSPNGDGFTGMYELTAGLEIWVLPAGDPGPTVYSGLSIEGLADEPGAYIAPTDGRIRFAEVDAVGCPGVYELQFRNELFAAGRSLVGAVRGVAGAIVCPFEFQLSDPVRGVGSPTALPNAAADADGGLLQGFLNVLTSAKTWTAGSFARLLLTKLGLIGRAPGTIIGAPVTGEELEIYVGEDCLAELGRSIDFELELPYDATAHTWYLGVGPKKGATVFGKEGTATLIEDDTYLIRFEPGNEETSDATAFEEYGYTVTSEDGDGKVSPRVEGVAKTRRMFRPAA